MVAVVLGLVVAGAVVALVLPGSGRRAAAGPSSGAPSSGGSSSGAPAPGASSSRSSSGSSPGAAAGAELARWAGTQLPASDRLVAAPDVVTALQRAGAPGGVVTAAAADAAPPAGTLRVTGGAVPAGSRLVAAFGSPRAFAVVDPAPVAPTAAELQRRRDLAAAVLANPTTRAPAGAAAALRAGAVDPRLLSVLAALTARSGIGLAALPAAPDEPADVPLARTALIATVGGRPVTAGSPDAADLLAFLRAQLAPYTPDSLTVTADGVLVGYRYRSDPDAAVTAASY